jgi:hypothetical protein
LWKWSVVVDEPRAGGDNTIESLRRGRVYQEDRGLVMLDSREGWYWSEIVVENGRRKRSYRVEKGWD